MHKLRVIGLGPGHPDYLLPIAKNEIEKAEVILCGERHLESFDHRGKQLLIIGKGEPLSVLMSKVKEIYTRKRTAIVVSGDTGYYSLLSYTKKIIPNADILTIPGISSLQYFFAKLNRVWQDAALISLHGREQDLLSAVHEKEVVGILTDNEHNTAYIGRVLKENNYEDKIIYVGEELSYKSERISRLTVEEALNFKEKGMAVVVIAND